ncbi:hypothetical protein Gekk315_00077 [Aeromonas phage Gekk3-15]
MKVELNITFTTALIIVKHLKLNPQEGYEAALAYLDELRSLRLRKNCANELAIDAASTVGVMWAGSPVFHALQSDLSNMFVNITVAYWQGNLAPEDATYVAKII